MKTLTTPPLHHSRRSSRSGAALILTLSVLSVLTILVIGFAISMRVEQIAARNYSHSILARQLADMAVEEGLYLVRTNTPIINLNAFWVSQPGRILMTNRATGVGSSSNGMDLVFSCSTAGNDTNNLNRDQSIIGSNAVYSTAANRIVMVNWVNIGTNGQTAAGGNPLIGRYAFWADDEGGKVNINSAGYRTTVLGSTNADVDLSVLNGVGSATASNSWSYSLNPGFFTAEQWKDVSGVGATVQQQNKFYTTAYTQGLQMTPWGARKVGLNTLPQYPTGGIPGSVNDPTSSVEHPGLTNWFGQHFGAKYGGCSKQILANARDWIANATTDCTGSDLLSAGGIPTTYLGLKRQIFLNEITAQVTYGFETNNQMHATLWIQFELLNPNNAPCGNGYNLIFTLDKFRVSTTGTLCPGDWFGPDTGSNIGYTNTLVADIPANSYAVYTACYDINSTSPNPLTCTADAASTVVEAWVRLFDVRLLQGGANSNIRDWCSTGDLQTIYPSGNAPDNGAFHFVAAANARVGTGSPADTWTPCTTGAPPDWSNQAYLIGAAKNDPRVRTFTGWTLPGSITAWKAVGNADAGAHPNATPGAENSVVDFTTTGVPNIPVDVAPSVAFGVTNHPSFYWKTVSNAVLYESVGELGYIHTGLPWRTIRLQPRPATEATTNMIPDWAVLDIFAVDTNFYTGKININAAVTNLYTGNGSWRPRLEPLASVLTAITAANNMGNATDQIPITTNIHNLIWADTSGTGWGTARTAAPFTFLPGRYCMIGELCEVDRVASNGLPSTAMTNDFAREARIRSFANLVDVRSERFMVHGIGQAIKDVNNDGDFDAGTDIIQGEAKVQAVIQRVQNLNNTPDDPNDDSVSYKVIYFRYLQ